MEGLRRSTSASHPASARATELSTAPSTRTSFLSPLPPAAAAVPTAAGDAPSGPSHGVDEGRVREESASAEGADPSDKQVDPSVGQWTEEEPQQI